METFKSVELLRKYFQETPKEKILADWNEVNEMDLGGPTIEELFFNPFDNIWIENIDNENFVTCEVFPDNDFTNYSAAA